MSPLRSQEQFMANLQARVGLVNVSTAVAQANTMNIAPAKLTYFDTTNISTDGHFTVDAANQIITVNQDGLYQISGIVQFEVGNTKVVELGAYINDVATGLTMAGTGRGAGKPVSISYSVIISLTSGDIFTIYGNAEEDSTDISVTASSVALEKTVHG